MFLYLFNEKIFAVFCWLTIHKVLNALCSYMCTIMYMMMIMVSVLVIDFNLQKSKMSPALSTL